MSVQAILPTDMKFGKQELIDLIGSEKKTLIYTGITVAGIAGCWAFHCMKKSKERHKLTQLRERKQIERTNQINKLQNEFELTPARVKIVEMSMEDLVENLRIRDLTAVEVLTAFIAKSLEVNADFNCITEFYLPTALEMAKELDEMTGMQLKGPLHGIPFCVKDDVDLAGMDTTVGCSKFLYQPAKNHSALVELLIQLGGIPFCKTNCPQTCCSYLSQNPIFGQTRNPLKKDMCPGGSSSGTACLVAGGGCLFGTGSDTGGSLRNPAHFCGISTIKPTRQRVSVKGAVECFPRCIGLTTTPFVMTKNSQDLSRISKYLFEECKFHQVDAVVPPIPWNEQAFSSKKKLKIGYISSVSPLGAKGDIFKTISDAADILKINGHELVQLKLPIDPKRCLNLIMKLFLADLGKHLYEMIENDEVSHIIKNFYDFGATAGCKARVLSLLPSFVRKMILGPGLLSTALESCSSSDLWDSMAERKQIVEKVLDFMDSFNLDVIMAPPYAFPSVKIDTLIPLEAGLDCMIWNLLDFPAGVVNFSKQGPTGADPLLKGSVGMPIGIQVIGRPYNEEKVLRLLCELEQIKQKTIGD